MRTLIGLGLAASILLSAAPAMAEDVTEPGSGYAFAATRSDGGKNYTLVGVGLRKKFIVKVYAMALYAEQDGGKKAYAAGARGQALFVRGSFDKIGVLHFLRDVGGDKIREAYRESLAAELKSPEHAAGAEAFIALFDRDPKKGDDFIIRTSADGRVEVTIGGQKKVGPQSAHLASAIWNIWLGPNPPTADMRTTLVSRIDALGK